MNSIIINILTLLLTFNFTLYYLDEYKISKNKIIGILQLLSPIFIILIGLFIYIEMFSSYDKIFTYNLLDKSDVSNPNITVGANIEISKEAGTEISKGISTLGKNIGLAGCVVGVAGSVAKAISKSSLPPIQKAGIIASSGIIGGAIQVAAHAVNTAIDSSSSSTGGSNIDGALKFIGNSNYSPLVNLILSINAITASCLTLAIILFSMILFRFILNEDIKLNLSNVIGIKLNNSLNYYLVKIIQLNKKSSNIFMFIALISLIIGLSFNIYFITQLYDNLDSFINLHTK